MASDLYLPDGFRIGHWEDPVGLTGCTVILTPRQTVGGCDVRGNSPGSRELALLASEKRMQEVHALLLTGGSAFGLAAADGVMHYLEEHGEGYKTPWARVPIVPAAVIFDLNIGVASARPRAEDGYQACADARGDTLQMGSVGAGMGATVGKWAGLETRMRGGLGIASTGAGDLVVAAVAVVNAVGDVVDEAGRPIAGARTSSGLWCAESDPFRKIKEAFPAGADLANTTLVAILTNARLSKVDVNRVAQRGHNGLARAIRPVHTLLDGDIVFALASSQVESAVDLVSEMATLATERAIREAVLHADALPGVHSLPSH